MTNQTLPETPTASPAILYTGTPRRSTALLILTGLWLIIFFAALFAPPLLDDADATHANAARHMALSGDLVTLHVNGIRYLEKAPLSYWLVALSFRIFGFNTFAAHLPQAIAVLLLAFLGFHWAARAYNPRTAFYTGLAILTSAGVFLFTRYFIPEVLLSLFLATALYYFLRSLEASLVEPLRIETLQEPLRKETLEEPLRREMRREKSVILSEGSAFAVEVEGPAFSSPRPTLYPYLMWATLALAVLTKGLVALVFFFGAAALYLALTSTYKNWRSLKPFTGALLFLLIAAPWHILAGLRNTGGMDGHGFFWFYFVNEHVLRFLGKRYPMDYNKLPGYLFWSLHLVWLFPWSLFCGALIRQAWAAFNRYTRTNPMPADRTFFYQPFAVAVVGIVLRDTIHFPYLLTVLLALLGFFAYELHRRQKDSRKEIQTDASEGTSLTSSPALIHTPTLAQQTTLLLSLFSGLVLVFFSLSTNQEYYTFPAYLPLLILLAAALTQAEAAYSEDKPYRRALTIAHATFTVLGAAIALALAYGLWTSRHLAYVPDIGELLAHRDIGNYTLSMSHFFDLTTASFAALRLPAVLALLAFAIGPAIAWLLRRQRRHLAATTAVALTSTVFLIAAHIAFARFGPMLSSHNLAAKIQQLEANGCIAPNTRILLYGDQAYGSSIPFYLGRQVSLVDGRSSSMIFGGTFPDAPPIFLTSQDLLHLWGHGQRNILFVPLENRTSVDHLLGNNKILLKEASGKALYTDRPLDHPY
jgi:4-amino-4-deoxy-L-arabinose transferase-like glycosyltransferase